MKSCKTLIVAFLLLYFANGQEIVPNFDQLIDNSQQVINIKFYEENSI